MAELDLSTLDNLSEAERKMALEILQEYANTGKSELFEDIKYADFEEIPVDIETFLHDKKYLGNGLYDAEGRFTVYPFWEETLKDIFPNNTTTKYNTVVLTGCLAYDTEIPLLNGKVEKIGDLAKIGDLDEYVYSYDVERNSYVPGHLIKAFSTGVKPVYEIELDNGTKIKATSNHKFMTRDKHWKSIDSGLTIGDSMMPFNRTTGMIANRDGYEIIENPNKDGTYTEVFTHRLVMQCKRGCPYKGIVHHRNFNKRDNDPRNLLLTVHKKYHARHGGLQFKNFNKKRRLKLISPETEQAILDGALLGRITRWSKEEEHKKMSSLTTQRMNDGLAKEMSYAVWHGENAEKNRQTVSNTITKANKENGNRYQISKAIKVSNLALIKFGELNKQTYEQTKIDNNMRTGYPSFDSILKRISFEDLLEQAKNYNHKIVKITFIGNEEVFDLTVEKYHNFAIEKGIVAHNSIGIGKSFMGVLCILYMLYRLLCLKDPYTYYGMQPIDKLSISFMNITLEAARGVMIDKMNQLILSSEWFMAHGEMAGKTNLIYRPEKHIEIITASSNNQIIGRAILANASDEVNFALFNDPEKQKKKMMKLITQLDARMKSRFLRGTYLPTINIICSSKDTSQSFLDAYIKNKKENESKTTLIVDKPQWVVDSRKDTPEKFYVGIGNRLLPNELFPLDVSEEQLSEARAKGYNLWQVPMGYLETFQLNLDEAICSIIGISTDSSLKYISGERLNEVKTSRYMNPFLKDIIEVGNGKDDFLQYSNFFDMGRVSEEDLARPLFIHLDLSISGDKTGIAGTWITGKRPTTHQKTNLLTNSSENAQIDYSMDLQFKLAFSVSIKAPKGAQVSFEKTRTFIRWLRDRGFAIKCVSADTYNSAPVLQELKADGFNTEIVSVDRVDTRTKVQQQYAYFKSALYERRVEIYEKCDLLTEEILQLERLSNGKIEHQDAGKHGSKDQCDAFCGSLWDASQFAEEYSYSYGDSLAASLETNDVPTDLQERQQFIDDFEKELCRITSFEGNQDNAPTYKPVTDVIEYARKTSDWDVLVW